MEKKILFVDDEQPILKTFQRFFRGSGFIVFTAESGPKALEILAQEKIDIIISDMRMPQMSGHELLRRVKALYPATIRLILSGYAEEKEIIKALLDGSCKMYILKPWDSKSLQKTILQLLEIQEVLQARNILTIINKIDNLQLRPRVFSRLMELIDANADMQQIAAVVEEAPLLTAKVLHMVNSAFYGIRTGSINQAIVYLGLTTVKNIVLLTCLGEALPDCGPGLFSREALWQHATRMNRLVNRFHYRLTGKNIPPIAASVGLVTNIGLTVLVKQMPAQYKQIAAALREQPGAQLLTLEREIIGVTHPEVGGYLLDWWGFPQPIIESTLFHCDPFHHNVTDRTLVAIVCLAHYCALQGNGNWEQLPVDDRVPAFLHITREDCKRLTLED